MLQTSQLILAGFDNLSGSSTPGEICLGFTSEWYPRMRKLHRLLFAVAGKVAIMMMVVLRFMPLCGIVAPGLRLVGLIPGL